MLGKHILFFLSPFLLFTFALYPQQRSISISTAADSLQSLLAVNNNTDVKKALIEEYLQNSETEIALLELLDFNTAGNYNDEIHHYSGEILLGVGNFRSAIKELKKSYLRYPTEEKLINIAISYYGLGNKELSKRLFDQLLRQNPKTDDEALTIHAKLYKSAKGNVTGIIPTMYKEFYPEKYSKYFPTPLVTILSPENFSTVSGDATVVFSVTHSRAIVSVLLNDEEIYASGSEAKEGESFSQNFSSRITVPAGPVKVVVKATDLYGFTAAAELQLIGLGFYRESAWRSSFTDSLYANLSFLNSFVPKEVTKASKSSSANCFVFCPAIKDNSDFQKSLFWFDLLTSDNIGNTERKNAKPLFLENASIENFKTLYEEWLIKSTNFQSGSVIYLNSPVRVSDNEIKIRGNDGNFFDILPNLITSFRAVSAGTLVIFDGEIDKPQEFTSQIEKYVKETQFPVAVIAFNNTQSALPIIYSLTKPEDQTPSLSEPEKLTAEDISKLSSQIIFIKSNRGNPALIDNPAGKAVKYHRSLLEQLDSKLKNDKVPAQQVEKIRVYSSDWKMTTDISRFLRQELSLNDLIIKIDEYNSRKGGF